jgi:hypothetical protein
LKKVPGKQGFLLYTLVSVLQYLLSHFFTERVNIFAFGEAVFAERPLQIPAVSWSRDESATTTCYSHIHVDPPTKCLGNSLLLDDCGIERWLFVQATL